MRAQIIEALKTHAEGHIEKHKAINNPKPNKQRKMISDSSKKTTTTKTDTRANT